MLFKVKYLKAAIENAIAADQARHAEDEAKAVDKVEQAAKAWVERHAEDWAKAGTLIARKARKGQVIRDTDLPRANDNYGGSVAIFRHSEPTARPYVMDADLKVLANVLTLLIDDPDAEISTGQLSQLGVRAATIRTLASSMSDPKA